MKIRKLVIENIKGIKKIELENIGNMAVIAGPNGCGKSCIFDALRLLKTSYGTYTNQEITQFHSEFGIKNQELSGHKNLFRDVSKKIVVECFLELSKTEIDNIENILEETIKKDVFTALRPKAWPREQLSLALPPSLSKSFSEQVEKSLREIRSKLHDAIQYGKIEISANEIPQVTENQALSFIFSHYFPNEIGSIIHISANRHYQKNTVSNINIGNINNSEQIGSSSLYDTNSLINKFHSDLASNYIFSLIKKDLKVPTTDEKYLSDSVNELFEKFIPNKKFNGPQLDEKGNLRFIVKTSDGHEHDINDLSSGEKEILMGYIQIFGKSPKDSILMFDEPELHLNPRLIKFLPEFYRKHLGEHFDNQIWLVTHSDTLLSESSKSENYSVFHITPAETSANQQAHKISSKNEADKALLELVGDLSQYKPDSKIVIVEGENSEFDKNMISKLFPDFSNEVNLISAGSKNKVTSLHNLMEHVFKETGYSNKIFGIVDMDHIDTKNMSEKINFWDSYHIENYLLIPEIISSITMSRLEKTTHLSASKVKSSIKEIAKKSVGHLAKQSLQKWINHEIINNININCDKNSADIPEKIKETLLSSKRRVIEKTEAIISSDQIRLKYLEECETLEKSFQDDSWIKIFPGRDILKEFKKQYVPWMEYEGFRDLIIDKMKTAKIKPEGMRTTIEKIMR